jgi:cytochrome c biogenesis protein CcmG/thiol:disulfide interchange protein DsbE
MRKYLRYLIPLALFAGVSVFLFKGLSINPRVVPSPLIGKPVPEFTLPRLKEPEQTLSSEELKGRVYLLNVWATWCVSCRTEHPLLVQLSRAGLVDIYGLNWKDDRVEALSWLRTLGDPFVANAFDESGRVAIDWGVYGAPETFVVDRQGIIRYKYAGPLSVELLKEEILPLVNELKSET